MMPPTSATTCSTTIPGHTYRLVTVCLLLVATGFQHAAGDEVQIGAYWQRRITIEDISDGQVIYIDSVGAERIKGLADLKVLHVSAYPDLAKAHHAIAQGDDTTSLKLLSALVRRVRKAWLKHWVLWQRMHVLVRLGQPMEVVMAYLDLGRSDADAFYLQQPPIVALANATPSQRRDVHKRLTQALPKVRGAARDGLNAMLKHLATLNVAAPKKALVEWTADTPPANVNSGSPTKPPHTAVDNRTTQIDAGRVPPIHNKYSAILLPRFANRDDPINCLLKAGKFEQALNILEKILASKQLTLAYMRWYQRGLAKCALAERATNSDRTHQLYKDAGLDFMRVAAYFPSSRYCAVSLVEAGYVHARIGRSDKASQLYEMATKGAGALGADKEPEYHKRLQDLRKNLRDQMTNTTTHSQ